VAILPAIVLCMACDMTIIITGIEEILLLLEVRNEKNNK
jgi:arginine exporter protein ArgO